MIGFVILHYMVENETKKCVDSILNVEGEKKIIIVDNCSPNDSYIKLQNYYNNNNFVDVLQNKDNLGFACGNNVGYEYLKRNYDNIDFIVVMNNDMEILQKNFIKEIYEIYKNDNFYVLAPDVFSTSNKIHQNPEPRMIRSIEKIETELKKMNEITNQKLMIKAFLKKIPLLEKIVKYIKNINRKREKNYLKKAYNQTLHGSCLIFSRNFINEREYAFFPKTRFYCEAQILDYECERNGWLRVYSPQIQVFHHEDVATNASYKGYYQKALFMNECMRNSLKEFKDLIKNDLEEGK